MDEEAQHQQQQALLINAQPMSAFADAETMRNQVRQSLAPRSYSVHDLYHDSGFAQVVARHRLFDLVTRLAAAAFIVYTGLCQASALIGDVLFLVVFSSAWIIRFAAFRRKIDAVQDFWFINDGLVVFFMATELCFANPRMACYLRSIQIALLAPVLLGAIAKRSPELMIIIKGLLAACRSVFFIIALLVFIGCIFGIVLKTAARDTSVGHTYFDSLGGAMYTLLVHGALLDHVAEVGNAINQESGFLAVVFFTFIPLAITLMVLGLAVTAEVVSAVSAVEKENMTVDYIKGSLLSELSSRFEGDSDVISQQQLEDLLVQPTTARALQDAGIDVISVVDGIDNIFKDSTTVSATTFIEFALEFRGGNNATVKDALQLRNHVDARMDRLEQMIQSLVDARTLT